ncbi:MAG: response regulator transcription factor [Bacteroidia bacterium]|nr:response regulator transcription factor [Bacteroidia bacterium]
MSGKRYARVLVVDDDRDILDLLSYNLEKEGLKVKTLDDSAQALTIADKFRPDLIILDIMMPHPNGIEICRDLRRSHRFEDTYIFFLTAKSESYYRQAALDTGGDDFIEKVVGLRALTHKVSSVLKNQFVIKKRIPELRIGNITISRKSNSVRVGVHEIPLSKPEFELLFFFAQNPNKTITLSNLLHNIWGSETYLFDSSIDAYIRNLSKKLGVKLIEEVGIGKFKLFAK